MTAELLLSVAAVLLPTSPLQPASAPGTAASAPATTGPEHVCDRPNILLITADDMNWDSPGAFGGRVPGATPNIDRLAAEGMRFTFAHVTVAVCQPSRSVLMTGRYPHRNGAMGFEPIRSDVPTLQEILRAAGYLNGILGKTEHLAPPSKFCWDAVITGDELDAGRNPGKYYAYTRDFLARAVASGRPFFLMANAHDPHRPFAGSEQEQRECGGPGKTPPYPPPDRIFRPDEIVLPPFLPDLPESRREVAEYFSSVRRCDHSVGEILQALDESGLAGRTLVMFLSDNGMSFPFAKTTCYPAGTRTPWIVRWPGRVRPGSRDDLHMISGIDFMPTVLEAAGLELPPGMDGRSFLPLLLGGRQKGRDLVFTMFDETSAGNAYPMRAVQDRRFGYIFNAWSDGRTVFRNEAQSGLTFKAMQAAAAGDAAIAGRVRFFQYRAPEELYDFEADPAGLHNLVDDPAFRDQVDRLAGEMLRIMTATGDPLLEAFKARRQRASFDRRPPAEAAAR